MRSGRGRRGCHDRARPVAAAERRSSQLSPLYPSPHPVLRGPATSARPRPASRHQARPRAAPPTPRAVDRRRNHRARRRRRATATAARPRAAGRARRWARATALTAQALRPRCRELPSCRPARARSRRGPRHQPDPQRATAVTTAGRATPSTPTISSCPRTAPRPRRRHPGAAAATSHRVHPRFYTANALTASAVTATAVARGAVFRGCGGVSSGETDRRPRIAPSGWARGARGARAACAWGSRAVRGSGWGPHSRGSWSR